MKILILTQYYPPETGAPQNRLSSLAVCLQSFGNEVEVLTAMPNYPKYKIFEDYKHKKFYKENIDNITVYRSYIFVTNKKALFFRLMNYFSFTVSSYFIALKHISKPDAVICESPPLFLGITAMRLKKRWKCKLIFNVSDLWPESAEKMGLVKNRWLLRRSYSLANKIYKNSDLITGQTQGIVEAIKKMQPAKKVFWLPNGIDRQKLSFSSNGLPSKKEKFTLLYAGIIGHAQGLEVILHAAHKLEQRTEIQFYIIGDGPVKKNLVALNQSLHLSNVTFISNQPLNIITQWLQHCDAYIVPLRKLDLFKGAIPSKLFEPLFFAKSILLGVEGEAKELFIDEGKAGLFFEPENADDLAKNILQLFNNPDEAKLFGENGKKFVDQNFQREKIAAKFWEELKLLCAPGGT
ncbi:MAG: glycosyltransferase family 4 protein [Chitinophagaceae bacterium]